MATQQNSFVQHFLSYGDATSEYTCNCERPPAAHECGRCHHYFYGRLRKMCAHHPKVIYLMDFLQCPYCQARADMINVAPISWEEICKFEEAALPGPDDL